MKKYVLALAISVLGIANSNATSLCNGNGASIIGSYLVGLGTVSEIGENTDPYFYVAINFGSCTDYMYFADKNMLATLMTAKSTGGKVKVGYCSGCTGGVNRTFVGDLSVSNRLDFISMIN